MEKPDITAVVLAKNEERNLPRCLKSLRWVKKIILVDDFSSDKTVEIAKKFGAEVYQRKLDNFASQRNWALQKVKTSWVFFIDPDEEVPPEMEKEILQVIKDNQHDGFRFPRKNIIFGKWIQHTGWYPDWQLHIFKTDKGKYEGEVHEQVVLAGKIGELKTPLIHYNYQSVSQYLQKMDRYSSLGAERLIKNGYQFDSRDLLTKPSSEFFRRFFAEEGWKDGLHGLALSLLQSFSELVVYLKFWEKEKFKEKEIEEIEQEFEEIEKDLNYWIGWKREKEKGLISKILWKVKRI